VHIQVTLRRFGVTSVVVQNQLLLTILSVSPCILALVIQHVKRMCPIVLPSMAFLALLYFSTAISQTARYSKEKKKERRKELNINCVF